jgi:hypothetical protein
VLHTVILLNFTIHTLPTIFHSMIIKNVVGAKSLNYQMNKK